MLLRDMLSPREEIILDKINVNAPAFMLRRGLLEKFVAWRVHPEIGLEADSLDTADDLEWRAMADTFEKAGLTPSVHGPFIDLAPGSRDQKILDISRSRYARAIEVAALFKPKHMVFHMAYEKKHHIDYRDQWVEICLATWLPLARRARELGILLVMENTHEYEAEEMKPLLKILAGEGVGFCFDIGHANSFGKTPVPQWLEGLHPYLKALHLHDNDGGHDEHLAIGQGNIDFPGFFKWLVQHGIEPHVTLEPHKEEHMLPTIKALAALWPWEA